MNGWKCMNDNSPLMTFRETSDATTEKKALRHNTRHGFLKKREYNNSLLTIYIYIYELHLCFVRGNIYSYCPSRQLAYKTATKLLHTCLSLASLWMVPQLWFMVFISASANVRQVVFCRPCFCFSLGSMDCNFGDEIAMSVQWEVPEKGAYCTQHKEIRGVAPFWADGHLHNQNIPPPLPRGKKNKKTQKQEEEKRQNWMRVGRWGLSFLAAHPPSLQSPASQV